MREERLRLGVIFNFHARWTGGLIYIINCIKILNFLEDKDKPQVVVLFNPELKKHLEEIDYPYLECHPHQFQEIYKGYIRSWFRNKNYFADELIKDFNLDAIYPLHYFPVKSNSKAKLVPWIADFQELYYPEFFTKLNRFGRWMRIKFILRNSNCLVVSSHAVKNDLYKFFKVPSRLKVHVYHFVSIIDNFIESSKTELREKYNLPEHYFIVSNQFHKHKNHRVVFKALAELKKRGANVHIAVTGRFPKSAESPYLKELHDIIEDNDLHANVSLLDLIPRGDQLMMMKYASAVIQPSLFEGWSTVIEDARSLQTPVIAANIPVNVEQLGDLGTYFEPRDYVDLAEKLINFQRKEVGQKLYKDYDLRMREAAYELLAVFK
jgi:glycosyltransferase involved in cell wall biosynthesis